MLRKQIRQAKRLSERLYDCIYDVTKKTCAGQRFFVLAQGRSGSTLLTELLDSLPETVCEGEILYPPAQFPYRMIRGRSKRYFSSYKAHGFKAKPYQIHQNGLELKPFILRLLEEDVRIIHLQRQNHLLQALSTMAGMQREKFVFRNNDTPKRVALPVNKLEVFVESRKDRCMKENEAVEGLPVQKVSYEDDLLNGDHQQLADNLAEFIGVPRGHIATRSRKAGGTRISNYATNTDELIEEINRLDLEHYLQ